MNLDCAQCVERTGLPCERSFRERLRRGLVRAAAIEAIYRKGITP
jgi:hypothetical protein